MLTGKLSMGGLNEKQAVPIYYIYKVINFRKQNRNIHVNYNNDT